MQIVRKKITELKPAPYNPRVNLKNVNKPMYDKLKHSIDTFGLVQPIIYNKRTGNIVGGHQRLDVLKENNETEVDCVEVDLNDNDEKALNVALNKVSGDWDTQMLNSLLINFKDLEYNNIGVLGFDEKEINEILDQFKEPPEENFELPKEPKYKITTGEIYILENHRLMCGDSTKKDDINKLMSKQLCNLVVTSPPYFNQREYSFFKTIEDYNIFIYSVAKNLPLDKNAVICWNVGGGEVENYDLRALNSVQLLKAGLKFSDCIVWRKSGGVFDIPRSMHITNNIYYPAFGYELIFIYKNGTMPHFEPSDQKLAREHQINVWEFRQVTTNAKEHPAAFPIRLPELCIRFYSTMNKIVFDPFGGSGSTLIACEQLNRRCFMMEIDPYYCSVILERWETYTNKKAEKIES